MRYSQIIGSLIYLAGATKLDISYAVNKLCRFASNLEDDHWKALECVVISEILHIIVSYRKDIHAAFYI